MITTLPNGNGVDGQPPPSTGVSVAAGSIVAVVSGVWAIDIPLPFTHGLLACVALNGDHTSLDFWCEAYSGSQLAGKATMVPVQPTGVHVSPGSMLRLNYIAVGW